MKTLTVKFTFTIMPDEFGLYSLPEAAKKWIKDQRGDCLIADVAVMEVLPIEDAPTPGGLTQVRKRTRGPNKANLAAATGLLGIPADPGTTLMAGISHNGAGAEVARGAGEAT